jgi:hypothetical protein
MVMNRGEFDDLEQVTGGGLGGELRDFEDMDGGVSNDLMDGSFNDDGGNSKVVSRKHSIIKEQRRATF